MGDGRGTTHRPSGLKTGSECALAAADARTLENMGAAYRASATEPDHPVCLLEAPQEFAAVWAFASPENDRKRNRSVKVFAAGWLVSKRLRHEQEKSGSEQRHRSLFRDLL